MEAIVLFIASIEMDFIVDIILSVVIRDVIACLRNASETNLKMVSMGLVWTSWRYF